jgi:Mce-associated membrane protein
MSETAPSDSKTIDASANSVVGGDSEEATAAGIATPGLRFSLVFVLVVIAALAGVGGWLGLQAYDSLQVREQHARFLEAGKEAAVRLTTISHTNADADVKRILDSATGQFSEDFRTRSQPFVAMVKQVQSTTVGTVADAGLEAVDGDKARVLVAVSVKTTLGVGGAQPMHVWRMRIDVQKVGNETKVSNVEFVA